MTRLLYEYKLLRQCSGYDPAVHSIVLIVSIIWEIILHKNNGEDFLICLRYKDNTEQPLTWYDM